MVSATATQWRMASLTASLRVRDPVSAARTSVPSRRMRNTFSSWRAMSTVPMYTTQSMPNSAAAVAVATPCWPAPVSATRLVLPMRRAKRVWPSTLLILWLPV